MLMEIDVLPNQPRTYNQCNQTIIHPTQLKFTVYFSLNSAQRFDYLKKNQIQIQSYDLKKNQSNHLSKPIN